MKLNQSQVNQQIQRIAEKIFLSWKEHKVVVFKEDEKKVLQAAVEAIKADYQKEIDLDREVNKMLDQLEKTHQGEFQRYKMYPLLKQKLAKEKKVIL